MQLGRIWKHNPFLLFLIIFVLSESEYHTSKALFWKPVFSLIYFLLSHGFLVTLGCITNGQCLLPNTAASQVHDPLSSQSSHRQI